MIKQYKLLPLPRPVDIQPRVVVGFKRPACQQGVATASEKALPHHAPGISSLFVLIQSQLLLTHQVLFLAGLASAVPAPEADPLLYTGHPLTYAVPYVTYHAPKCETEFEEVTGFATRIRETDSGMSF